MSFSSINDFIVYACEKCEKLTSLREILKGYSLFSNKKTFDFPDSGWLSECPWKSYNIFWCLPTFTDVVCHFKKQTTPASIINL